MTSLADQVEHDIQKMRHTDGEVLTPYGMAIVFAQNARQDAKDWMTKYKIEAEECERLEKECKRSVEALDHAATDWKLRAQKAERKNRLLANCIATLIDSEEFV